MEINVTTADIAGSRTPSTVDCPVARAICRSIPGAVARVLPMSWSIDAPGGKFAAKFDPDAISAIKRFTDGGSVEPFTFEIYIPLAIAEATP